MNKIHKQRLYLMIISAAGITIAVSLILYALKQNINVFLTPSQIVTANLNDDSFRLGGMVKPHSVIREKNTLGVQFIVTDNKKEITVRYDGILPDLFHEGKGVIAYGKLNPQHIFIATEILAKHDENYMPVYVKNKQIKEGA